MTETASARGYDRLAARYRMLEYALFGNRLEDARAQLLSQLPELRQALLLGDGDGRFLHRFCLSQPDCRITSIDQSEKMLLLQRNRSIDARTRDRVEFVQADAREWTPVREQFDLLATLFFLDCFTQSDLDRFLPRWLSGVRPGGWFFVVEFHQPDRGWRRLRAKAYLSLMHWLFRWQTSLPNCSLVDLDAVLGRQPISLVTSHESNFGLIRGRLYRVDYHVE